MYLRSIMCNLIIYFIFFVISPIRGASENVLAKQLDSHHSNLELAKTVLEGLVSLNNIDQGISTMFIMNKLDNLRGIYRMKSLRLLELMDTNNDGTIGKREFVQMYAAPMSDPEKALAVMFDLVDYNRNGKLSVWEFLMFYRSLQGDDSDLRDLLLKAQAKVLEMDANKDQVITREEYVVYMLYVIKDSIGKIKNN